VESSGVTSLYSLSILVTFVTVSLLFDIRFLKGIGVKLRRRSNEAQIRLVQGRKDKSVVLRDRALLARYTPTEVAFILCR
jgi:hypothetical protein